MSVQKLISSLAGLKGVLTGCDDNTYSTRAHADLAACKICNGATEEEASNNGTNCVRGVDTTSDLSILVTINVIGIASMKT